MDSVSPQTVFSARGVTKIYRSGAVEVPALRGVDLDLFEGELAVLLGPSGSGKSTLLNILGGLDRASAGKVLFRGGDLTVMSERQLTRYRRDHVGFVFQFYNLIPSLTALENVALVAEIAPHPMSPREALATVGLQERMDHFPAQLSGGEQQRVAIARAIVKRPEVLLCDEPTGALDSRTGVVVLEALTRINADLGTTTAIITHNAGIRQIAHRFFTFVDGRIVETVVNEKRITMHGAPVHIGKPELIGISDVMKPDYGDAVDVHDDELPVFWACGVTPQSVIATVKPEFCITHYPGCMLVTDRKNTEFAIM